VFAGNQPQRVAEEAMLGMVPSFSQGEALRLVEDVTPESFGKMSAW
jgi:hypothetical protein